MGGVLVLGLLVGMRHALEADHVAAVAALAQAQPEPARRPPPRRSLGAGAHADALCRRPTVVLSLDGVMPEQIARIFEFAVGIMLVLPGRRTLLRRLVVARVHFHAHRHGDGTTHFQRPLACGRGRPRRIAPRPWSRAQSAAPRAGGGADARPRRLCGADPADRGSDRHVLLGARLPRAHSASAR